MTKRLTLPAVTATWVWCTVGYYSSGQQSHSKAFCPVGVSCKWQMRQRSVFRLILQAKKWVKAICGRQCCFKDSGWDMTQKSLRIPAGSCLSLQRVLPPQDPFSPHCFFYHGHPPLTVPHAWTLPWLFCCSKPVLFCSNTLSSGPSSK